jgi:hypothetical protein
MEDEKLVGPDLVTSCSTLHTEWKRYVVMWGLNVFAVVMDLGLWMGYRWKGMRGDY